MLWEWFCLVLYSFYLQILEKQSDCGSRRNVTVYKGTEQPVRGICRVLSGPSSGNERDHNDLQNGLVTGSNFEEYQGKTQAEAPLIQNITEETEPDTLFSFRYYGSAYFGVFESYGENDLYVFYPVASVFS